MTNPPTESLTWINLIVMALRWTARIHWLYWGLPLKPQNVDEWLGMCICDKDCASYHFEDLLFTACSIFDGPYNCLPIACIFLPIAYWWTEVIDLESNLCTVRIVKTKKHLNTVWTKTCWRIPPHSLHMHRGQLCALTRGGATDIMWWSLKKHMTPRDSREDDFVE